MAVPLLNHELIQVFRSVDDALPLEDNVMAMAQNKRATLTLMEKKILK